MAQLSLYIDDETMKDLREAAFGKGVSLSEFARMALKSEMGRFVANPWPNSLWESFGAIDDESFAVPEELPWDLESPDRLFD